LQSVGGSGFRCSPRILVPDACVAKDCPFVVLYFIHTTISGQSKGDGNEPETEDGDGNMEEEEEREKKAVVEDDVG